MPCRFVIRSLLPAALATAAALVSASASAGTGPGTGPDGVRVLTYNTAFLYTEARSPHPGPIGPACISCDPIGLPPLSPVGGPCDCWPSMSMVPNLETFGTPDELTRADLIADEILATDQDVVVLNEVFDPDVRARFVDRLAVYGPYTSYISTLRGPPQKQGTIGDFLRDMYAPWLVHLEPFVDYEAVPADSGLMVFSKLPFLPLTGTAIPDDASCADEVCWVEGDNAGSPINAGDYAFDVYDECQGADCWASKGVGIVKIDTPRVPTILAFTHMQADYPEKDEFHPEVRANQFQAIRDAIIGSVDAIELESAFVVLAGDLNVLGSQATWLPGAETQEWHDIFDPAAAPNTAAGLFACGNGVASGPNVEPCRFGVNGSALLSDPWGFRHSSTDLGFTHVGDDQRLDYLAHSHASGRMCPQHMHIAWDLMADLDGGKAWLSDHLPVRGDFALSGEHCSPSDDPNLFAPSQNAHPLTFGPTNCADGNGPNPPCHQDEIVSPPQARIAMGGNMQWFRIDQAGSYSIDVEPVVSGERVSFVVYHHTDLSRPIQPFDQEETEFGVPYSLPDPPYYIRTFAVDAAGVPDRTATRRSYTLSVHQHLCRDPLDACFLEPGLALTAPYAYLWPTTVDYLSEVRELYWRFKTSGVAGGIPVTDEQDGVLYPTVDFLIEAGSGEAFDCITRVEPVIQDYDEPSFPTMLVDEHAFVDILVGPEESWDLDLRYDERWVAPELGGKVHGELATYFVRLTRDADHTDGWNPCNFGMTSSIAYDTNLTFFAPQRLQMWAELDDDLGAEDNLLVHSGFDAGGPWHDPAPNECSAVNIEEPSDGSAVRSLLGRPELRGYYVDALWPTLWEQDEEELIHAWGEFSGIAPLSPLTGSFGAETFKQFSDAGNGDDADYYYYYWYATCHLETELACAVP